MIVVAAVVKRSVSLRAVEMDDISAKVAMIDPLSQWQSHAAYITIKIILDVLRWKRKGEGERVVMMREVRRQWEERATLVYAIVTYSAGVGVPFLSGTTGIAREWAPPCLLGHQRG